MKEITLKLYSFSELEESVRKEIVERERWNVMGNSMEAWSSDWQKSLSEFEKMTDTNVRGWQVDYCTYRVGSVRYKQDGPVLGDYENGYYAHELKGKHLFRYLNRYILPYVEKKKTYWGQFKYDENGKCIGHKKRISHIMPSSDNYYVLTGYCGDYCLLKPILDFIKEWPKHPETTWDDLLKQCYNGFFEEWHNDYRNSASDEFVEEELSDNSGYERFYLEDGTEFRHSRCVV